MKIPLKIPRKIPSMPSQLRAPSTSEDVVETSNKMRSIDKIMNSAHEWLWVYGTTPGGRRVLLGPLSEGDVEPGGKASNVVDELQNVEMFTLETRNRQRAKEEIRVLLAEGGHSVDDVLGRHLGEKGVQRALGGKSDIKNAERKVMDMLFGGSEEV